MLIVVAALALPASCGREATPIAPPRMRRGPSWTNAPNAPNAPVRDWMTGCYSIERPAQLRWTGEPRVIGLSAQPLPDDGYREKRYQVRSIGKRVTSSAWWPIDDARLEIDVGTGFGGSVFRVERAPGGLRGRAYTHGDVSPGLWPEEGIPAFLPRVPCVQ